MTIAVSIYERVTVGSEGMTLSRIIWNRFRRPMPGLAEFTLDKNQGLAESLFVPVGTTFSLPIPDAPPATPVKTIRLWD